MTSTFNVCIELIPAVSSKIFCRFLSLVRITVSSYSIWSLQFVTDWCTISFHPPECIEILWYFHNEMFVDSKLTLDSYYKGGICHLRVPQYLLTANETKFNYSDRVHLIAWLKVNRLKFMQPEESWSCSPTIRRGPTFRPTRFAERKVARINYHN